MTFLNVNVIFKKLHAATQFKREKHDFKLIHYSMSIYGRKKNTIYVSWSFESEKFKINKT